MLYKNISTQILTLHQLLQRDLYVFRQEYLHKLQMALYWSLTTIFIAKNFMPAMGLEHFGSFMFLSTTICYGFFTAMRNAMNFIDDMTHNQTILYDLTLPVQPTFIFLRFAISTMIQSCLITIALIPCGLLVLGQTKPFPEFSFYKFIIILLCSSIFYGTFTLIFTANIKNFQKVENVWARIIFPLWYLGCFQFPWKALYKISPTIAYLNLLNPLVYITEGARNATIDPHGTLSFGLCCCMILLYSAASLYFGILWMKKRLDCV